MDVVVDQPPPRRRRVFDADFVALAPRARLAAHPDDPPLPLLRGVSKLIYHPDRYQKMLDLCECGVCLSRRYLSMFPQTF